MGCSSSSAQTVDQEKKPGTKPEESNGGTLAVRNGIIAETIDDKTQLPASALGDDLQQAADDGAGAVLMVMEAQEGLGSGEDLLTDLEPQADPVSVEETGSAAGPAEASSDAGFADVAVEAVAKTPSKEEIHIMGDGEMEHTEVPSTENAETFKMEVSALQDDDMIKGDVEEIKVERPTLDIEPVQAELPVVGEQASVVPAEASPEAANPVVEPAVADMQEALAEVPDEEASSLETAAENYSLLPALAIPESPASTEAASNEVEPASGDTTGDETVEDSTSELKEAIIDTRIAVATIPEMPLLVLVTDETQAEQQPVAEESNDSVLMSSKTALQVEPSCSTESTSLQGPSLVEKEHVLEVSVSSTLILETSSKEASEVSSAFGASPSSVTSDCALEVPAAEPTQTDSPVTVADQAFEPSTEVSAEECHQDLENDRAKKED
ncbi:uncharacterized protein LOC144022544 isoform X2 [Festucalex cinctus]